MKLSDFCVAAALAYAAPALAEDVTDLGALGCQVTSSSAAISIVLCEARADDSVLAEVGRLACEARKPCGAWIYDSADAIPLEAPESHAGLTQAQVTSALGVWVAESEIFISIAKVE